MNSAMELTEVPSEFAARQPASARRSLLASLLRAKIRIIGPILIVSVGSFLTLTIFAGFFREFLVVKISGPLNIGFALIFCDYVLILTMAIVYVMVANLIFDPMADQMRVCSEEPA
jgi:uncharacterized membrane protein (DUF485 family)